MYIYIHKIVHHIYIYIYIYICICIYIYISVYMIYVYIYLHPTDDSSSAFTGISWVTLQFKVRVFVT